MKKGISIWSFAEPDIKKCFKLAKDAGFDGVEVALDENGPVSLASTKEEMLELKAYAESLGLKLYSVASGLYWSYNYTSEVEENREKAKSITRKQLEIASWLGCDTILVAQFFSTLSYLTLRTIPHLAQTSLQPFLSPTRAFSSWAVQCPLRQAILQALPLRSPALRLHTPSLP